MCMSLFQIFATQYTFCSFVHQFALMNLTMILFYYMFMRKLRIIGVFFKEYIIMLSYGATYNNTTRDFY